MKYSAFLPAVVARGRSDRLQSQLRCNVNLLPSLSETHRLLSEWTCLESDFTNAN